MHCWPERKFSCVRKTSATVVVASCLVMLLAAPAFAANADVHIVGGAPNPSSVTINEGDTVTIFNDDSVEHTIFAAGRAQAAIPPGDGHEFGPFQTGGEAGRFDYRVDQNGPAGTIFVQGPAPTTTTTTTRPTTTIAPTTTTSTTTTLPTTTTSESTTTTSSTSTSVESTTTTLAAVQTEPHDKETSNRLAVLGFALLVAGMGGLVIAMQRSRRRRAD